MKSNTNDIFSKTECISSDVLKSYLTGNISDEEKRKAERHLVDCEMCNDELEGLQAFENIEKFDESVNDIKQKILFRFGRFRQKSNAVSLILGIAASVLIAIISGYLIMLAMKGFEKKEIAQHVELKKEKTKEIVIRDLVTENKSYNNMLDTNEQEKDFAAKQQDNKSEKSITTTKIKSFENGGASIESKTIEVQTIEVQTIAGIENDLEIKDEGFYGKPEATISTVKTIEAAEEPVEEKNANLGYAVSYDAIETIVKEEKSGTKIMLQRSKKGAQKTVAYQMDMVQPLSESPVKNDLELSAKQAFQQNDYKNAYKMFLNHINTNYESDSAFYYLAVSCFYIEKEAAAITYFNKIKSKHIFAVKRKWYLANAYLKADSVAKAIPLLNELSQSQNKYTAKAAQKLSEILSDD